MIRNLFFLLITSLLASEELVVPLATQSPLTPVYVSEIDRTQSPHESEYERELERVLTFDVKYGGKLSLSPRRKEREEWLKSDDYAIAFNKKTWLETGCDFVIKPILKEKSISITLFDINGENLKRFSDIPLSGKITDDRRRIHNFIDKLHKRISGNEGIASTRILYAVHVPIPNGKWISEIWESDYDGANKYPVTNEKSYCISPTFLPSKKAFAYVNYKLGQPKIYLTSFKDKVGLPCVELRGNQLLPTFSRQGNKIAFISDASGRADLFVQAFDPQAGCVGKPIQAYTFPSSVQASPSFSPDGMQIAFVSDKDGTPRIYLIETPIGRSDNALPRARCLTTLHRDNTCPSWSPDGTKLAYSAKVNGTRQIMLYDWETNRERQITKGIGHKENPSWAKNSFHLVYNSVTEHESELFLLNTLVGESVKITSGEGRKHYPAWEP